LFSATPPPSRRIVIQPAAIRIIRRDRLPVWGGTSDTATATAGAPSPADAASLAALTAMASLAAAGLVGVVEAVAKSTDGGDHVGTQLLADAGDENLDRVRIAVEILVIDVLDQLGSADHLALVVHQVAEQLVFLRGQLDRLSGQGDAARARVEANVARNELRAGVARGAADQRPQTGDQLFGLERLGEVVVGAGIEPGDLVGPRIARGQNQDRKV